jgi:LysM repeat protein
MQRSFLATAIGASLLLAPTVAKGAVHTVAPGETLSGIAAADGLSPAALAAANGLSPDAFVIAGRTLQIPAPGTTSTSTATSTSSAAGTGHLVVPGETLSGIAAANGISAASLAAANGLSPTSFVIAGTRLRIPGSGGTTVTVSAPASSAGSGTTGAVSSSTQGGHLVQPGETLSGIAAANGISLSSLASANGLSTTSFAIAGTRLRIPSRTASTGAGAPEPMGGYVVRPGDTLSALATRSGVSVGQIAYMNGLDAGAPLIAGRALKLPTGSPALGSSPAVSSATPVAPAAAPQATPGRMTSSEIQAIAAQNGVPGSLAAAIAWQESGFNNAMVSSTSARGVMQVMPGTWDWVQAYLTGGRRLNPFSAEDNVRAGTLYLGHLLRQAGGDPALAAAGYYQGLASVRQIGMLPETRRYVANVLALRGRFGG